MDGWKDPNGGVDSTISGFMAELFAPLDACLGDGGSKAGFEKRGLSVSVGTPPPPREGHSPQPMTPSFSENSSSGRASLAERLQARAEFSFSKLCVPCAPPAAAAAAGRSLPLELRRLMWPSLLA
ncbi:hypothetical protein GUJ93_ZPchr0010g10742 [Zizania palustris]|uniref:Uncharacterized protein n=1 Tax=Zizania palustris TaxID=103762 RepID=A0A8J5TIG7_ZIZPA|nr:hypothetical protein GUJ93_ZPchr0010g10742 [Zizania palustris]